MRWQEARDLAIKNGVGYRRKGYKYNWSPATNNVYLTFEEQEATDWEVEEHKLKFEITETALREMSAQSAYDTKFSSNYSSDNLVARLIDYANSNNQAGRK